MNSNIVNKLIDKVISGHSIDFDEALLLSTQNLQELCSGANYIREHFCKDNFSICTIISGKTGNCSEDCKFCAQSSYTNPEKSLSTLTSSEIICNAAYNSKSKGAERFSIVTSGRRLSKSEIKRVCEDYKKIAYSNDIKLCSSAGLLDYEDFVMLKQSGVSVYHNNLESSREYFKTLCTTHSYDDKLRALENAKKAGLKVCCGGIIGMGESMTDRISMAMDIRSVNPYSIPINVLNPIPNTPFAHLQPLAFDEVKRVIALYRFIFPDKFIRLAGGRSLLPHSGRDALLSGANALISGDMLTTGGATVTSDIIMAKELGYKYNPNNF